MNRTVNFTELRRELSRTVREPFFRRIGSYRPITVDAANYLADTALGRFDASEGWPYAFAYVPAYGDQREIVDFLSDGDIGYAYVSPDWSTTPAAGSQYEIHSIWSAQEKLDALNHAIHDCWPAFYEVAVDESIVIEKWQKEYSLNGLAHIPRHLLGVYIEPLWKVDQYIGATQGTDSQSIEVIGEMHTVLDPLSGDREFSLDGAAIVPGSVSMTVDGVAVVDDSIGGLSGTGVSGSIVYSSGAITLTNTLSAGTWSVEAGYQNVIQVQNLEKIMTPDKNWSLESGKTYELAVYYGTGAGQYRTVDTTQSTTGQIWVTTALTTGLDATSEFCVKNVSDQSYNWQGPIVRYRVDSPEAPSTIALHWDATEYWGAKLRLIYAYEIEDLTAESSAVPAQASDFLVHMAAYHLWLGNIGRGPQFETKTAEKLAQQNKQDAEELRERNRMKRLTGTIRIELDNYGPAMREKPFSR